MNEDLLKLLKDFEVEDVYIQNFEREKIKKISTLKLLNEKILEKLFPEEGPRLEFNECLKNYFKISAENNNDVLVETPLVITSETPVEFGTFDDGGSGVALLSPDKTTARAPSADENAIIVELIDEDESEPPRKKSRPEDSAVLSWCESDMDGKLALGYYKVHKSLDDEHRTKLAKLCVSKFLENNNDRQLDGTSEKNICEQILKIFSSEKLEVWMGDPDVSRELAGGRGKLVTTWYALRRKMKKLHLLKKKNSPSDLQDDQDDAVSDKSIDDALIWLENNKQPWGEVLEKWKLTSKARRSLLMKDKIQVHLYMDKYPALKDMDGGSALYNTDFETCFPGSTLKLFSALPRLCAFILDKLPIKEKEAILESLTPEGKNIRTFMSLTNIFPVVTAVVKSKRLQWRPSRQESREALFQLVKDKADIQTAMNRRREKYGRYGLSLGPQAILVGLDEDFVSKSFVLVNNVLYDLENPIKALDTVFKCMHALDTPYTSEIKREWLFLQVAVYDIKTAQDQKTLDRFTKSLISEYQKFQSPD